MLNNEQHLFTSVKTSGFIKKNLKKALEGEGYWVFLCGETHGRLNEDRKNHVPFPKDYRVSCLSDTGLVSLPEPAGGTRGLGERAPQRL
jgi:hypothetical protein